MVFVKAMCVFLLCWLMSCSNRTPSLQFLPEEIQLDTIIYAANRNFTISLKNTGKGILEIHDMTTGCDCTILQNDLKRSIEPGDTLEFKGTIVPLNTDIGNTKSVLCTFKTNTGDVFHSIKVNYFVMVKT